MAHYWRGRIRRPAAGVGRGLVRYVTDVVSFFSKISPYVRGWGTIRM
jgi:hypothetical protein